MSLFDLEHDEPPTAPPVSDPLVRTTDPEPSRDGAKPEPLGHEAVRVLRALVELERTCPHRVGATAPELMMRMAFDGLAPDRNCVSRRLTSLVRHGFAVVADEKRDGGRGVNVSVYCATAEGRGWLRG